MTMQPGEPPAGDGTDAAADAARENEDPGSLQVDLEDSESTELPAGDTIGGLAPGVHETDKDR